MLGMESLGTRIRHAREKAKLSQAQLAERVGIKQPSVQAIETGKAAGTKHLMKLSEVLGVTPEWLSYGKDSTADRTKLPEKNLQPEGLTSRNLDDATNVSDWSPLPRVDRGNLINVLGSSEAGPGGAFLWNGEVVDRVPRPPSLSNAPNGYALFVHGESMLPRYEPNEVIYVHPGRAVAIGSYVVIQVRNPNGEPPLAFLKRLVRRTAKFLVVEQFNPRKEIEIPSGDVISVHRVVGSSDA